VYVGCFSRLDSLNIAELAAGLAFLDAGASPDGAPNYAWMVSTALATQVGRARLDVELRKRLVGKLRDKEEGTLTPSEHSLLVAFDKDQLQAELRSVAGLPRAASAAAAAAAEDDCAALHAARNNKRALHVAPESKKKKARPAAMDQEGVEPDDLLFSAAPQFFPMYQPRDTTGDTVSDLQQQQQTPSSSSSAHGREVGGGWVEWAGEDEDSDGE
jgi:hypothetical protein